MTFSGNNSFVGSDLSLLSAPTTGRPGPMHARMVTSSAHAAPNSEIGRAHRRLSTAIAVVSAATDHLSGCQRALREVDERLSACAPDDDLLDVAKLLGARHLALLELSRAAVGLEHAQAAQRDHQGHVDGLLIEYESLSRGRGNAHDARLIELGGGLEGSR
jgi:hypothetical protein